MAMRVTPRGALLLCGLGLTSLFSSTVCASERGQGAALAAEASHWPRTGGQIAQEDRSEIADLLARYVLYADAAQGDDFAALFTDDGELTFNGRTIKGRADLAQYISGKTRRTLHLAGAPLLAQVAPGHMRVRSELLFIAETPQATPSGGVQASQTIGFSTYDDDFVLTPHGWKIARRQAGANIPLGPEFLTSAHSSCTREPCTGPTPAGRLGGTAQ